MPARVEALRYDFGITGGRGSVLNVTVTYSPIVEGQPRPDLADTFSLPQLLLGEPEETHRFEELAARCEGLRAQLEQRCAEEVIEIDGATVAVGKIVRKLWAFPCKTPPYVQLDFSHQRGGAADRVAVEYSDLTDAQQRLLDSIATSVASYSWRHLREKFAIPPPRVRRGIFISYRKGHELFAEALALRLGKEGFLPWFDKWETLAGDSLPGKIEEGLANSMAFVAIVTRDYPEGNWATEELQSAIHRRIEQGYPIIPILLEDCPKPELIRHLIHVDFRGHDPQQFESKMGEVIDAINRLDRNPFR